MSIDSVPGTTLTGDTITPTLAGASVTGTVDFGGDQDWYQVTLTAGSQYVFELLAQDSEPGTLTLNDPFLRLLNASGFEVVVDDDSGLGLESRITYTASATGILFLSAQGYTTNTGTFRLTATDLGDANDVPGSTASNVSVPMNGSVAGTIGAAGDQDWYRVTLTAGRQYSFDLLGVDTGSGTLNDPLLRLLNGSGTQLATDDDSGVGLESHISFAPATSGIHYLSAQAVGSGAGSFLLQVNDLGPATVADIVPGSTASTFRVNVNESVAGTINPEGDQDWYKVTLDAGTQYRFDLQGFSSEQGTLYDPYLQLLDATGVPIAANDDADGTLDSSITHTAGNGGTYYLSAQGFGSGTGTFNLSVTSLGSIPIDTVPDNTGTGATLAAGNSVAGTIDSGGDEDWYRITLVAGHEYRFDLTGVAGGDGTLVDPLLRLLDAEELLALNDDDSGSLDSSITYTALATGEHYLSAQGFGTNAGTFLLSATDLSATQADVASGAGSTTPVGFDPITGTIDFGGDQDWYKITLAAGHTYVFDLQGFWSGLGTLSDPYLRLLNEIGGEVIADDDSGNGLESSFTYTPAQNGDYFVAAQGFGQSMGTFTLDVDDLGPPVDVVPGSIFTPYFLPIGQSVTGLIDTGGSQNAGGDQDWYQVTLQDGHQYRFELLGVGSRQGTLADPYLRLLDSAGNEVAYNDDLDYPSDLESHLTFLTPTGGPPSGTYYLSAQGFFTNIGTYRLNALDVSAPVDIPQDVVTASSLQVNSFVAGNSVGIAGDQDWYRVVLESGHMYEINLRGSSSGGGTLPDPYLRIFNSLGGPELENDDVVPGNPDSRLQITAFDEGTFYLSAGGFNANVGTYTLELDEIDVFGNTATVATVGIGRTITGTIDLDQDQDWFLLSTAPGVTHEALTVGQTYRVDLRGAGLPESSLLDPFLRLLDSTGAQIDFNDDSGGTLNSSLTFVAAESTTYYISAESFGSGTGTFELALTQIGGEVFPGTIGVDALVGTPFNDQIYGFEDNDILDGKEGDDYIDGWTGDDTLAGGAGDDRVFGWDGNDVFTAANQESAGNDSLYGEAGNDEFSDRFGDNVLEGGDGDDLFWLFVEEYGNNLLTGGAGRDTYRLLPGLPEVPALGNPIYVVTDFAVGPGGDLLDVDALLEASAADGYFVEGTSSVGNFIRIFQLGTDALIQWDRDGTASDTIGWVTQASLKHVDGSKIESGNFAGVVDIGTKTDDHLVGGLGDDNVVGVGGNDTLDGGGGEDILQGGSGDDTYYVDDEKDVVLETSNTPEASSLVFLPGYPEPIRIDSAGIEGIADIVIAAVNFSLANFAYVEDLALAGPALRATGNALANKLTGNGSANELTGGAGNDLLDGGNGNDTLVGGTGSDTLNGGAGSDTASYVSAAAAVTVSLAKSGVQSTLGAGNDTLSRIENLSGGKGADKLTGNEGANRLEGGAGNDTIGGGTGNDTIGGDTGNDTLNGGTGNDTLNGGTGNDTLNGGGGNDGITGGTGNDVIKGLSGADVLTGGSGADRFDFDALGESGTTSATRDRIIDFSHTQKDRIDLSTIDANGSGAGDTAFKFIGGAAFSGNSTGKLRFHAASHTLYGSTDADTAPEFSILLPNLNSMVAGDFIL